MKAVSASRYRFVIAALILPVRLCVGIIWGAAGPLLPLMMQEFGVSRGNAGWFASVSPLLMMVFAVPSGIIANKVGIKKAFAIGAFLQASAIVAPLFNSFPLILLTRVLFGIGIAMTIPLVGGIIAQWFNRREVPLINGFSQASTSLGNAFAFYATIRIAKALSWRGTLALYSGVALIFAFLWLILGREHWRTMEDNPEVALGEHQLPEVSPLPPAKILRQKATSLLAFSLMGAFCLFTALSSWLPTYYHEVFKMSLASASSVAALLTLVGIPACILGGIVPMRLGLRKPLIVVSGFIVGLAALGCFMVNNPVVISLALTVYGIFGVIYTPSVFTIPMELPGMTPQTGSLILALALAAGNLGSFMGPLIVGYLADLTGSYIPGFLICCLLSLSLLVGGLLLPETGPRASK